MYGKIQQKLGRELAAMRKAGTYKSERIIISHQRDRIRTGDGREVINLCANNYLGLADDPTVAAAASAAIDRWGYGMASVRFICGTQQIHKELEARIADFLGTDDAILFGSCFDANAGLFEALLGPDDAVISDALNHASIIDGIRLCRARRLRYSNGDMAELEAKLNEASNVEHRMIATDGVFSMDGYVANLPAICDLAERWDALVMVDDSHATGFFGPTGRGTPEYHGVAERVDIITSTLGKALGGASGGFAAGRSEIIEILRQRARPYLFSNTLSPIIAAASIAALDLVQARPDLLSRLSENASFFRREIAARGLDVLPGTHPITPVMIGDAGLATQMADGLLERGVYVVGFSHPVVPLGRARIRAQVSAAHSQEQLATAAEAFGEIAAELGIVGARHQDPAGAQRSS